MSLWACHTWSQLVSSNPSFPLFCSPLVVYRKKSRKNIEEKELESRPYHHWNMDVETEWGRMEKSKREKKRRNIKKREKERVMAKRRERHQQWSVETTRRVSDNAASAEEGAYCCCLALRAWTPTWYATAQLGGSLLSSVSRGALTSHTRSLLSTFCLSTAHFPLFWLSRLEREEEFRITRRALLVVTMFPFLCRSTSQRRCESTSIIMAFSTLFVLFIGECNFDLKPWKEFWIILFYRQKCLLLSRWCGFK